MSTFAQRLKSARLRAGLSLRGLGDKLAGQVSHAALGKYEKGQMQPGSQVVIALADALDVPVDYFFQPVRMPPEQIMFRKKSKLSKTAQKRICERARDFLERYLDLEELLGIEERPELPASRTAEISEQVRSVAGELRDYWDMGLGPINDLFGLLEEKGVKVLELDDEEAFDGLSGQDKGYALIVVNRKYDPVRKRFSVAHELAHLVLDFPEQMHPRTQEKFCNTFAGAFVLPPQVVYEEFGVHRQRIALKELLQLKENYGISIQAIGAQLHDLGIFSESHYRRFCQRINQWGWRKNEPGEYTPHEQPRRFMRLLFRGVSEEVLTLSKGAALADMSVDQFRGEVQPAL